MIFQNQESETNKKFFEIENFLDQPQQNQLLKFFLRPAFPWALTLDAVKGSDGNTVVDDDSTIGLFHTFIYDNQLCSEYFKEIDWILDEFEKINLQKNKIIRVRAGLFLKHPSADPHTSHVDAKVPHTTAVYYVNDCDGDILIYNETYKTHPWSSPKLPTEISRFSPSMGKLVVFDGEHYHASSYPNKKPFRLAITFNFLK
jgi:hypothetical protein